MTAIRDLLTLEVRELDVPVLTGIYSEETHLPQPLRISVAVEFDCPDHFAPDTPLSASKNYMDIKRAMTTALPEGRQATSPAARDLGKAPLAPGLPEI